MLDRCGREINYMRISITDRCNLRCRYCMPKGIELLPMKDILTYEEIERVCTAAAGAGIRKLKITGGEPLVRLGCAELIGRLKRIPGIEQVTLTTNGVLLERYIEELMGNRLDAVNISLDTLDRKKYQFITGRDELSDVVRGIDCAVSAGLPAKINVVLQKGMNDQEWENLARLAKDRLIDVRFIELMPIGYGKECGAVSNEEILEKMNERYKGTMRDIRVHGNGPAVYYKIPGYMGSIGFISAMHGKFCDSCNRIRLTSTGKLKPCLCYDEGIQLREILRKSYGKEIQRQLRHAIEKAICLKPNAHCFESYEQITENHQMVQIGG